MANHYHFVGIGGSGMGPLADLMRMRGHTISGSDRGYDRGDSPEKFKTFADAGMVISPQDGSGVVPGIYAVVVSSAVEESIPDIQSARQHNIPVLKRAEVLADLFNAERGIGIAGTSGKTTTTGMVGWMLQALNLGPTIANGGVMVNFIGHAGSLMGNAVGGASDLFVAEMDESDGTIALFNPAIAVLNNVTLDHKPFDVIEPLFRDYLACAREAAIINLDDPRAARMMTAHPRTISFGIDRIDADIVAADLKHLPDGITFTVKGHPCTLRVPGRHNVLNALASVAVAVALGHDIPAALAALEQFRGIKRRLEVVGSAAGVTMIDDFAHNPDKITASLETLTAHTGRVVVMFQPHGFAPMKLMRTEIVDAFASTLRPGDILMMPEIFYAGGSVTRDISSNDLIVDIRARGIDARFFMTRAEVGVAMTAVAKPGDRMVVMGARDDTLTDFARTILHDLRAGPASGPQSP